MKDAYFKDIAIDWRICKIRIKLRNVEHDLYGLFTHVNIQSPYPAQAIIEVWNKSEWDKIEVDRDDFSKIGHDTVQELNITSQDIEDLEIIGFYSETKPPRRKILPTQNWVSCISEGQNTLPNLDVEHLKLIRDPKVLHHYYTKLGGKRPFKKP